MSRRTTIIIIIVIALFIFGGLAVTIGIVNFSFWTCPNETKLLILKNRLLPIQSCTSESVYITPENKTGKLVDIYYGEGMDCPAGCIFQNYRGLLFKGKIYDTPYKPALDYILEKKFSKEHARWCIFNSDKSNNFTKSLTHRDNQFLWTYTFTNYETEQQVRNLLELHEKYPDNKSEYYDSKPFFCTLNGTITFESPTEADISNFSAELSPLENFIPLSTDERVALCLKYEYLSQLTRCLEVAAQDLNNPGLCSVINTLENPKFQQKDLEYYTDLCQRMVAQGR